MDEESLELAFGEVAGYEEEGESLQGGVRSKEAID